MPRRRIIDDTELEALYRQGLSHGKIGEALGVSRIAILNKCKRLGLSRMPESLNKLTDKQKQFCISVASGMSGTQAVTQGYDVTNTASAKSLQTTLMKDPEIRAAIDDLMEMKGVGRDFRVGKLGEHMNHKDPVISLKALDMGFKLSGDFAPERALIGISSLSKLIVAADEQFLKSFGNANE